MVHEQGELQVTLSWFKSVYMHHCIHLKAGYNKHTFFLYYKL